MKQFILIFLLLGSSFCFSQNWLQVDSVFSPDGVTVESFSAPVFADIDNDDDLDLFLGNINLRVAFFRNIGTQAAPFYQKDTSLLSAVYANGYQYTNSDYPAIVDINADSLLDLVIGGYNGILLYINRGTKTEPVWYQDTLIFATVNPQIGTDARPAFVDIDNDGDMDLYTGIGESLFGGPNAGSTFGFRNTGTAVDPVFTLDNTISISNDIGLNSYPAFADLNNDGDFDMLLGRDLSTFAYFQNNGTPQAPVWQSNGSLFAGVEQVRYWKDPTFCDYDNDGDMDLIYGSDAGLLYYYQNTGTPTTPQFQYNANHFKVIKLSGGSATSFLCDYDKDGDFDMLSGSWDGKFVYFKNDGTFQKPNFRQTATNFSNLDPGSYSIPEFVDIDGDGDLDIVSGALDGIVYPFINSGTGFALNNTIFSGIDVGWQSAPTFCDIDDDGDQDLLIGAETGSNTKFMINNGNLHFTEDNSVIAGITLLSYSRPSFADVDNDGDFDLMFGRSSGNVTYYENTGSKKSPVWTLNTTLFNGIKVKQNARIGVADVDGDGKKDLIIGEYDGNFTFFKNLFAVASHREEMTEVATDFQVYQNYPNPFNSQTRIKYHIPEPADVKIVLMNTIGEEVQTILNSYLGSGYHEVDFNASSLSSGVYFYKISYTSATGDMKQLIKKLILLK
ncbi:MAG TPA: FG-GAP-like repeat-containing protein [Ignavibacteriaceae bacterium]|nr:FG-GAP-like repeat-containing protein [Ignavibacteriaceae bacterium]